MPKTKFLISFIIPVFNETKRLYNLQKVFEFIKHEKLLAEVILINDGSTDYTLKQLKILQKKFNFKLISYQLNKGKGFAIRQGAKMAQGEYIIFTDIDLSTPLSEFHKFQPYLQKFDVIIGTRKNDGATVIKRQPIIRETLGKAFTFLSQKFLNVNVSDFTCGFKCFSKKAAKQIFPKMIIDRWGFDSEILFIATHLNFKIKEISVVWQNDSQTKVKFPQDIMNSLTELIIIRLNYLRGRYR